MLLDVALAPALLPRGDERVCIVVDVLRASTVCVTLFDRGAEAVAVAPTPEAARELRRTALPAALLCGEVGGLPPEGFDYGNSPLEFSTLDLAGRTVVLATSNGTRALHALAASPEVFVGCLRNRAAVGGAAFEAASRLGADMCIVCAGNEYGTTFSLDDAVAAGAMVSALMAPGAYGASLRLSDAALAARRLFASYHGRALHAFRQSSHGRTLERLGFAEDLAFCACPDCSPSVPVLQREPDDLLVLRLGGAAAVRSR